MRRGVGRSHAGRAGSARTSLPALPRLRGARGGAEGGSVTPSLCYCPSSGTAPRLCDTAPRCCGRAAVMQRGEKGIIAFPSRSSHGCLCPSPFLLPPVPWWMLAEPQVPGEPCSMRIAPRLCSAGPARVTPARSPRARPQLEDGTAPCGVSRELPGSPAICGSMRDNRQHLADMATGGEITSERLDKDQAGRVRFGQRVRVHRSR